MHQKDAVYGKVYIMLNGSGDFGNAKPNSLDIPDGLVLFNVRILTA